jgi:hypothetical protein
VFTGRYNLGERGSTVSARTSAISLAVWAILIVGVFPSSLLSCSVAMCAGRGVEMAPDFVVVVKLERNGLPGAKVEVEASNTHQVSIAKLTDSSGKAKFRELPSGDYWISVTYLGISAGGQCFHVRPRPSMAARSSLHYRWGDYGVPTRSVTGRLQEWQPGTGGTPIWNITHGGGAGATCLLQDAQSGETFRVVSDPKGAFTFPAVRDGIYVLHIEGGVTAQAYSSADMIVTVSKTATRDALLLTLQENGCGTVTFHPEWR